MLMADKKMPYESVMRIPSSRRERFLRWLKARSEVDRALAQDPKASDRFDDTQMLDVWNEDAYPYVPEALRRPKKLQEDTTMADSAGGLRYVMTFEGETKGFDAAIDRMRARLNGLGATAASLSQQISKYEERAAQRSAKAQESRATSTAKKMSDSIEKAASTSGSRMFGPKQQTYAQREAYEKRIAKITKDAAKDSEIGARAQGPKQQTYAQKEAYEKKLAAIKKKSELDAANAAKEAKPPEEKSKNPLGKGSALVVGMELGKAQRFAEGLAESAWNAVEAFGQLYSKTVEEAALFQDIESGLKFAFGESKFERVFENVKKEAAKTSFTLAEVAELTRSLGMLRINPFEDANGKAMEFKGRNGEVISSLEVLQDAASATGKSTKSVQVALREFFGGNDTSLARRLDIPLTKVHEWRKETKKAKDEQGQAQILFQKLASMYGGASAGRANNWNFLKDQVPDLMQQIYAGMGKGALQAMTPGLKAFMEGLRTLVGSEKSMKALAEGFTAIGTGLGLVMKFGGKFIEVATKVMAMTPHIPVLVMGLTGLGVASVGAVASVTALGLSLAVVAAGVAAVGVEIAAVALVPTLIAAGAAAAVFAVGASLMIGAFASSQQKASGFVETLEDAQTMITALQEAFSSWNNGKYEISLDSFEALEKRGLSGYFQEVIAWAARAQQFVVGFAKGFEEAIGPAVTRTGQTFDRLVDNVTRVMAALGLIAPTAETSMDSAGSAGEKMGARFGQVADRVLGAVDMIIEGVGRMAKEFPKAVNELSGMITVARVLFNVFQIGWNIIRFVGESVFALIYTPIQLAVRAAIALGQALAAGALALSGDTEGASKGIESAWTTMRTGGEEAWRDNITKKVDRAQDFAGNVGDLMNANSHARPMNDFADQMAVAMKDIDARREAEGFATSRREALSKPEVGYSRNPGEANFSGQFASQMDWNNRAVNPMVQTAEAVRQDSRVINITVQSNIDGNKVAENLMSLRDDQNYSNGQVMTPATP